MARYCIAFDTVKIISEGNGNETMEQLVRIFVCIGVLIDCYPIFKKYVESVIFSQFSVA